MPAVTSHGITTLFVTAGTLLAVARVFGGLAKRMHQPAVLGELVTGIVLGPTILGAVAPDFIKQLFPPRGDIAIVFNTLMALCVSMFLLLAGMELNLSTLFAQGKKAFGIGVSGLIAPFILGFIAAWAFPDFLAPGGSTSLYIFALFFATAMSLSALPLIAKTLMDLNLYRTDLGMLIIAAAMLDDLVGWNVFAVVLGAIRTGSTHFMGIGYTILLTLAFAVTMLTLGRKLINRIFLWIRTYSKQPGGILAFTIYLTLFGAAFTEWVGLHAVFGAFIVGVAVGDSRYMSQETRETVERMASSIFGPLFFAGIGLQANFIENFDLGLVLFVLAISTVGKVFGCFLGAKVSGLGSRQSWATGFALNARGVMEIIVSTLAMQHGLIGKTMFVALVIMGIVTSMMSGPIIQRILNLKQVENTVNTRA
jgi:Kef-type K+ transport system membrane component KefB